MSRNSPSATPPSFWSGSAREFARNSRNFGGHDLPRLVKDGCEWVWFPEGYWAERPTAQQDSPKGPGTISVVPAGKIFRWTSRANGSTVQPQENDQRGLSPKTVQPTPPLSLPQPILSNKNTGSFSPPRTLPHSPWLSEAAQVQALQLPADQQMSFAGIDVSNEHSPLTRNKSSGACGTTSAVQGKVARSRFLWKPFKRFKVSDIHLD